MVMADEDIQVRFYTGVIAKALPVLSTEHIDCVNINLDIKHFERVFRAKNFKRLLREEYLQQMSCQSVELLDRCVPCVICNGFLRLSPAAACFEYF